MSERVKAVRGNKERCGDVKSWLIDNGALNPEAFSYEIKDYLYYVKPNGFVDYIDSEYEYLFDVEEIPRWRAEENNRFYCIDGTLNIAYVVDRRSDTDNLLYEIGNYFQTKAEAVYYCDKFKEMLKERK